MRLPRKAEEHAKGMADRAHSLPEAQRGKPVNRPCQGRATEVKLLIVLVTAICRVQHLQGISMKYALLYVAAVVLVNLAFDRVPLLFLPSGEAWPPVSLIVGFIFVIRDYAQREIGHWILPAMLAGGALSWALASPAVALASMCAFLTGEFMDWAVYSFTRRSFSQRILLSSALSTPVDSAVFLFMMGIFSVPAVLMMTISKMVGACIVYYLARQREYSAA